MFFIYAAAFLLVLILTDLIARIYYGRKALHLIENLPCFEVAQAPPQKQAVPFELQTTDNITLRGSIYYPDEMPPLGIILFCPETSSNHWSAVKYAQGMIDSGYIVVSFDFRNQGESDSLKGYEPMHWVTEYEISDLEAVVNWIGDQEALQDLPLGILGISRGGATALMALSRFPQIKFIATDSSFTNDLLISHYLERWARVIVPKFFFKFYPLSQMRKTLDLAIWFSQRKRNCKYVNTASPFEGLSGKQIFMIAGAKDSYVPLCITKQLKKMLGDLCTELWVVPKTAHNGARTAFPDEYDSRLVAFFGQMLVPQHATPVLLESPLGTDNESIADHNLLKEKPLATN